MKIILFLAENDPNGVREARIDQWSGRALYIPRRSLAPVLKERRELDGPCLYFLVAETHDRRNPRIYVGEADGFADRIRNHDAKKDWWEAVVAFYSSDGSLTKSGIQYTESACIERLRAAGWCTLDNNSDPRRPSIPREDEEGLDLFAKHVATLMPILGFDIFAPAPADVAANREPIGRSTSTSEQAARNFDTIVCPAQEDGFQRAFLGQRAWWAVRINEQNIPRIKYVAIYQVAPISAITYYGEVERVVPFGDSGKFKLFLKGEPTKLDRPVGLGKNRNLRPQAPKYATLKTIINASSLDDAFASAQA